MIEFEREERKDRYLSRTQDHWYRSFQLPVKIARLSILFFRGRSLTQADDEMIQLKSFHPMLQFVLGTLLRLRCRDAVPAVIAPSRLKIPRVFRLFS